MRHRLPVALATAVAALTLLLAGGPPAGAHEGDAVIELEAAHPAGGSVHFIVRVTWEDDGHPATDATVTATAVSLAGDQLTPVALPAEDDDGRYSGPVEFPSAGVWTVRFTSIDPTGTLEQIQEVGVSPSTVPTTPAEGDSEVTVGTEADTGFAPEDDGTGASGEDSEAAAADGGDGGLPVWLIVLAAVVAVGGAVAALGTIRRYRGGPGPGAGTVDDPSPEPEPAAEPTEPEPAAEATETTEATEPAEPTGPAGGTGP
jgi:hypothetical protein